MRTASHTVSSGDWWAPDLGQGDRDGGVLRCDVLLEDRFGDKSKQPACVV